MPIKKIKVKPAIYVYKDKNPKVLIKSGPNKGKRAKKIKSPAKYKTELDTKAIYNLLKDLPKSICYIEAMGSTRFNSAKSTKTTAMNIGKILAVLEILGIKYSIIEAHKWKKFYNISSDKLEAVELAEKLSGISFRNGRGTIKDGLAEAYLIWNYGVSISSKSSDTF